MSSCDRWRDAVATDSLSGTEGVVDHYARDVAMRPSEDVEAVFRRLEERLLRYQIFPPRIMRAEICSEDGRLHEGTTIAQHVSLGPVSLEAAVSVLHIWRGQDGETEEIGFTYATLQGHPERGISTFRIQRNKRRQISFVIDVRSRPGSLVTRLARPLARRFQRAATEAALAYFTGVGE